MSVSNALRRLAAVVDEVETGGVEVCDATIPADRAAVSDGKVHVTLDLAVSLDCETTETTTEESVTRQADGSENEQAVVSGVVTASDETIDSADRPAESAADSDGADATETSQAVPEEPDPESSAVPVESVDETAEDGAVVCPEPGCGETFESEPGMKIHRTKIHLRAESSDEDVESTPAYRDPDALRDAYESHDSFPAMREALDVDVSAQTVRRHMIQHGIHDPTGEDGASSPEGTPDVGDRTDDAASEASGSDSESDADAETVSPDPESPPSTPETEGEAERRESELEEGTTDSDVDAETAAADESENDEDGSVVPESDPLADVLPSDVTAPADVTLAELKEAVRTADTLYDIQQGFGLDRAEAHNLLGHLDLLELVHGRVATKHEREELKAEIDSRIRHSIRENGTSA
ncbi:hypothetical protein [Halorientalis salina]|uniref:hypothetical protein n=1 Tax=Halorientalis salina TaxID=2932266 RepID=UPI0010ACC223|nr:hypothetical protein [Halorientalis salina]